MSEDYLEKLNEQQRAAVEYLDGPQLVIAGAGSGKTRVLTYKIVHLLRQGYEPWRIMALTFTNKAAREMKERIGRLVGSERAQRLQMGTFHSVFARILRAEADVIGFSANFTIYDQADARSLVKTIIKEMQLDDKVYKPASVADRISMAKNHLLLPPYQLPYQVFYDKDFKPEERRNRKRHNFSAPKTGTKDPGKVFEEDSEMASPADTRTPEQIKQDRNHRRNIKRRTQRKRKRKESQITSSILVGIQPTLPSDNSISDQPESS